jgi:hypothetical protein
LLKGRHHLWHLSAYITSRDLFFFFPLIGSFLFSTQSYPPPKIASYSISPRPPVLNFFVN